MLSPIPEESSEYEPSVYNKAPALDPLRPSSNVDDTWRFPDGKDNDDDPATPPSATSAYFDTSMETPERKRDRDRSRSRERSPRSRESSNPYEYPPNHNPCTSSSSLTGEHDPYNSTSTIHVERTPTVLQIRHSDDTFERDNEDGSEDGRGGLDGLGLAGAPSGRATPPTITYGQGGDEWGNEADLDERDADGAGDQAGVILGWVLQLSVHSLMRFTDI
jgi:hypothetical protein